MSLIDHDNLLVPGRVVHMRGRLWRIDLVQEDEFAATPLDGRDTDERRFHPLLEDIESGEVPLPTVSSIGSPQEQQLILDAYRLSLLHGTAPILGLQRSRAIPTDYQLVPLLLAMGEERVRMLIADSVGAGKTIEAGLILAELLARGRARRILVAVPANLRDQWEESLDHFFHIPAVVVAGHLLPALQRQLLPGQSVWSANDVVVASIDYLKTRTQTVLAHGWDAIVIDEAHLCAKPHTLTQSSNPDMERWRFAEAAAEHCRHLLLLTATPHNGYTDSYASLLSMLDPSLTSESRGGVSIHRDRAERHVVQRRRDDIEAWYDVRGMESPFPDRDADEVLIPILESRARGTSELLSDMGILLAELGGYTDSLLGRAADNHINGWIAAHLQRRALSSPRAIQRSLASRMKAVTGRLATDSDRRATAEARAAVADLFESADATDEEQILRLDASASSLPLDEEVMQLERILQFAGRVTPAKDPKLRALVEQIPRRLAVHPNTRRVIVFTKYKDTLDYLVENLLKPPARLRNTLPAETEIFAIFGDMSLSQRSETFAAFERAPVAVLVATDCISEGLNLQHACAELIHYELPWNPNRLEQRNGRIDRFGQREKTVGVRTLVYDEPLDTALLELIVRKSEQMRKDYGFVPPFLANPDILMHVTRIGSQHRRQMSLFEALAVEEDGQRVVEESIGADDLLDHERLERMRQDSFYGHAQISLTLVEGALQRSRDEAGSPETVERFVRQSIDSIHGVRVEEAGPELIRFFGSSDELLDVALPPETIMSFYAEAGMDDPTVEVLDVAHPLVRRLVDISRDRAANPDATGRIAGAIADTEVVAMVLHVLARYVATGDPPVLLEEILHVSLPVWGDEPVPTGSQLISTIGYDHGRPHGELAQAAESALSRVDLRPVVERLVAKRAVTLGAKHSTLEEEWARGLDHVEPVSWDVVAATVCFPRGGS
jgi:superfamily II DNA or RNA helicase